MRLSPAPGARGQTQAVLTVRGGEGEQHVRPVARHAPHATTLAPWDPLETPAGLERGEGGGSGQGVEAFLPLPLLSRSHFKTRYSTSSMPFLSMLLRRRVRVPRKNPPPPPPSPQKKTNKKKTTQQNNYLSRTRHPPPLPSPHLYLFLFVTFFSSLLSFLFSLLSFRLTIQHPFQNRGAITYQEGETEAPYLPCSQPGTARKRHGFQVKSAV